MGCLGRATFTVHWIPAQTSQKGIEFTIAEGHYKYSMYHNNSTKFLLVTLLNLINKDFEKFTLLKKYIIFQEINPLKA